MRIRLRLKSRQTCIRERALRHAALIAGPECAANLLFRCGPCDVCGGNCLCRSDAELEAAVAAGSKPVGTFCYRSEAAAMRDRARLEARGLACWSGRNRWGVFEVVASAVPDVPLGEWGTPRQVAFTQAFVDERTGWDETGVMFGYRLP